MTNSHTYENPVAQLLFIKEPTAWNDRWIDYPTEFGLTKADIPDLIRLSCDEEPLDCESIDYFIHALRALAQLDPEAALTLYLELLQKFPDDDFLHEEIYGLSREVGAIAIAPLVKLMSGVTQDRWVQTTAANGLESIAQAHPECREACVQAIVEQLRNYRNQDDGTLNTTLVDKLIQLEVVEEAALLAEVFENCEIDEFLTGSWPAAQVKFGLKKESDFSPEELIAKEPDYIKLIREQRKQDIDRDVIAVIGQISALRRPAGKGFGSVSSGKKGKKKKKKKDGDF
ncbi:hypothetical protein TUMEXPCC7403_16190 [Tumidithrix helvetica PCC 7403]|uniref:hypothetical protein n=1 Tax=Tumidithrix helvetica TaxID=3457545 RepID=UPI003CAA6E65